MQKDYIKIAETYAKDVISGKISACNLVKLSCQRHLDDLERQGSGDFPYVFNPIMEDKTGKEYQPGTRICAFAEKMKHVKGVWKGEPIILEPWQIFFLSVLFGWVNGQTGLRRFREVYAEIPRKNGKSVIGAIIGNYLFTVDGEGGAEVYSGATSEKQAWEVFGPARLMAKNNPQYKKKYGINVRAKTMVIESDSSKFEPLIGDPGDGASPHGYLCDEFHEHKTPNQYDTMATGMGARSQPMLVVITTAGTNLDGPCYEKRAQAVSVLRKVFDNDEMFTLIYTIDETDKWTDVEAWKKANPNYGVSVYEDYLTGRLREARQTTSKQNIIRCKHLNQWMTINTAWLDMEKWESCADTSIKESDFTGRPCYSALDLAVKIDMCAYVKIYIGEDGKRYLFGKFYLPEETAQDPKKTHYLKWVSDGIIHTNHGATIDFDRIEEDVYQDIIEGVTQETCYDPYQATQMTNHLYDRVNVSKSKSEVEAILIETRQTVMVMSEPMKELQKLIYEGNLVHNGCPIMTWMMGNVVAHEDAKENIYPRKENAANKIDGPVAAIMANSRAMVHKERHTGNDGSLI